MLWWCGEVFLKVAVMLSLSRVCEIVDGSSSSSSCVVWNVRVRWIGTERMGMGCDSSSSGGDKCW